MRSCGRPARAPPLPEGARISPPGGISLIRNPLAASGGIDAETISAAKLAIPGAFTVGQQRALTARDYATLATAVPGVRRAAAELRFTGSLTVADVAIQPELGEDPAAELLAEVWRSLAAVRKIGQLVRVLPPRYRPLAVALDVTLSPATIRREAAHHLARLLSNGWLPDGTPALFNPANLAFATPVYSSPIIAAVHAVPGVASVTLTRFGFLDQPAGTGYGARSRAALRNAGDGAPRQRPHPTRARLRARVTGGRTVSTLVPPNSSSRRAALLEQLIVALTSTEADALPIRTRAPDDPTVALLDAWATVGDVLGFYLDRIADEGYLTTATQPGSILALASLVGYQPAQAWRRRSIWPTRWPPIRPTTRFSSARGSCSSRCQVPASSRSLSSRPWRLSRGRAGTCWHRSPRSRFRRAPRHSSSTARPRSWCPTT